LWSPLTVACRNWALCRIGVISSKPGCTGHWLINQNHQDVHGRHTTKQPDTFLSSRTTHRGLPMLATVNSHLTDSLFRPIIPVRPQPEPVRDIQQAARSARCRWPELADMVDAAVMLVEDCCLYEMAGEPTMLAFCRRAYSKASEGMGAWQGHLISLTAAGLGCTCDAWPPAIHAGPGDGLYCQDVLAALLQVYLRRPLRPLPHSPETLWQEALNELQYQMTKATFTNWLAGTRVVPEASSARLLTIEVRNRYAQEWLTHRLQPFITRAVAGIAGYCLEVCFVVATMRSDRLRIKEIL
jgi:hypothetical protein